MEGVGSEVYKEPPSPNPNPCIILELQAEPESSRSPPDKPTCVYIHNLSIYSFYTCLLVLKALYIWADLPGRPAVNLRFCNIAETRRLMSTQDAPC